MSYYGSASADRAVEAYVHWCRRVGYQYDEPGHGGVDVIQRRDQSELIEIRGRYGIAARYVCTKSGRLRRLAA